MGSVWPAVKMDTLESIVTTRANKATLVKTVPPFAHHIVRHVDTQTDIVVVPLVIQDTDVPQNVSNHMERTVTIHAVNTVTTETVTDITEAVLLVVPTGFTMNGAIKGKIQNKTMCFL